MNLLEQYPPLQGTAILAAILFILHVVDRCCSRQYRTHDVIVTLMLRVPSRYSGIVWGAVWMIVSVILGIILPISVNNGHGWLTAPTGIIVSLNFSLFVPLLVLSYVSLAREVRLFFRSDNLTRLGLHWSAFEKFGGIRKRKLWLCIFRFATFSLTILVIWLGISAVTEPANGESCGKCFAIPWITKDDAGACLLNWTGLVYYVVVRGISSYMAIGLTILSIFLFAAFFFGIEVEAGEKFLGGGAVGRSSLEGFVVRLAWCVLLAPTVLLLHGLALFFEEETNINSEISTRVWLFFMVCSLFGTYLVLSIIVWFYSRTRAAEGYFRDQLYGATGALFDGQEISRKLVLEGVFVASKIEEYLEAVRPMRSINVSLTLGVLSAVLQVVGIGLSVYLAWE